jgi:hypothetical protein
MTGAIIVLVVLPLAIIGASIAVYVLSAPRGTGPGDERLRQAERSPGLRPLRLHVRVACHSNPRRRRCGEPDKGFPSVNLKAVV